RSGRSDPGRSVGTKSKRPKASDGEKLDEVLRALRGFGSQLSAQSYDIGLIKNQVAAQTVRCDQLTVNMTTLTNDIQSKVAQLEGQQSAMFTDLNDRFTTLKSEVHTQITNELRAQEARTAVPISDIDDEQGAEVHAKVQQQIAEIKAQLRTISTAPSVSSSVEAQQDNTCTLVAIGFPRKMLARSLKTIADAIKSQYAPQDVQARITAKCFDMAKKITFHFESASDATNFLTNYSRDGVFRHPDPLAPQNMLNIKLKRDQDIKGRQLFLSMGKVRALVSNLLAPRGIEVGSNGLGGLVYALKSENEPIEIAQIQVSGDDLAISVELDAAGLREFGLETQVIALRPGFFNDTFLTSLNFTKSRTLAIIRDLDIRCGVLGKLKAKMASDHIPIFINIEPFRPQDGPKNIPKWISKHPEFQRFLEAAIADMSTELGPWERLEQLKELMFASAAHVREFVKHEVANTLELKQYWALQALRDVKILAGAMSCSLAANTSSLISPEQKCVAGRDMLTNVVEAEGWGLEQHVLDRKNSCLFLTDFCAAFPSLAIPWMLHVLVTMKVCPYVCKFFSLLYMSNIAIICLGGRIHGEFIMSSGVKQGCPSSMLLFVLAADPLLRWVRFKASAHIDRTFAYADDFCFGLRDVFRSLGPLLALLTRLEKIAGLRLNFKKCQILVVGSLDVNLLRDSVRLLVGEFKKIQ
ncbi:unnamed protein product, partial [Prorocentrum cordatum]